MKVSIKKFGSNKFAPGLDKYKCSKKLAPLNVYSDLFGFCMQAGPWPPGQAARHAKFFGGGRFRSAAAVIIIVSFAVDVTNLDTSSQQQRTRAI